MRNVEVGLQAVRAVLRQCDHAVRERLLRFQLRAANLNVRQLQRLTHEILVDHVGARGVLRS